MSYDNWKLRSDRDEYPDYNDLESGPREPEQGDEPPSLREVVLHWCPCYGDGVTGPTECGDGATCELHANLALNLAAYEHDARAALAAMTAERDDLAMRAREVTCVWCGYQFQSTLQSQAEHLYEHAKVCEKHPVHIAEAKLAECEALLDRELFDAKQRERAEIAEAALAAMRSTPVGKLMADRDELTQDVQRLMRERDDLREALVWFKDRAFCNISPAETTERVNTALAAHGQRGGGENDAASASGGGAVEGPSDHPGRSDQAATPPPPAPSRADLAVGETCPECGAKWFKPGGMTAHASLLALVEAGVRAGMWDPITDNVSQIAARVLAAWEARDDR